VRLQGLPIRKNKLRLIIPERSLISYAALGHLRTEGTSGNTTRAALDCLSRNTAPRRNAARLRRKSARCAKQFFSLAKVTRTRYRIWQNSRGAERRPERLSLVGDASSNNAQVTTQDSSVATISQKTAIRHSSRCSSPLFSYQDTSERRARLTSLEAAATRHYRAEREAVERAEDIFTV